MNRETTTETKGKGCFFYGCLTVVILFLVIVGVASLAFWKFTNMVSDYTDNSPVQLSTSSVPEAQVEDVEAKIKDFLTAAKGGEKPAEITLTASDVNTLIASKQQLAPLKGRVEVAFVDDMVAGRVSIPLDQFGLKERYLNGSAALKVSCKNGLLNIVLDSLEVKGKPIPEQIMSNLRKTNLAEDAYEDPETVKMLRRIKNIEVRNGKMFIEIYPESDSGGGAQ